MTPWWSDREAAIERNRVQPEPEPREIEPPPDDDGPGCEEDQA